MSNNYYTHGSFPSTGAQATSASMRSELDLITAGFDKLPTLTGNANKFVVVNSLGTLLEVTDVLPVVTVTDSDFTVQDGADNSKKFQFQASGITPSTTRTFTMPDADTTLVGTGVTQTLTNKTLTSPAINGGAINNATIGATTANTGAFTSLSASGAVSGTGFSDYLASPPAIGGTAAAAGSFTTLAASANAVIAVTDNTNAALRITQLGTGNALLVEDSSNPDATPFVINASGTVLAGTTVDASTQGATIQAITAMAARRNIANVGGPAFRFEKSRATTDGTYTIVQNGDALGDCQFYGADGVQYILGASVKAEVDGTPGTNDMPGRLVFSTTADGASTPTEAMRINNAQQVGIGVTPAASKGTLQVGTIGYTDTGVVASFASSVAGYNQIVLQNTSSNAAASTNFNVSNDAGTASTNYGELGINSSTFTGTGSFSQAGYVYLSSASTDLAIGTYGANNIHFVVNSGATDAMNISSGGLVNINSSSAGTSLLTVTTSTSKSALKTPNIAEVDTISATAATGTINYDVTTQSVLYYTTNASGNWTLNFRGSSGTTLNTLMQTGESISATFLVTQGSTAYYNSAVTIDGTSVTPKWQGGSAPTSGNASSVDCYTYVIQKTGSATYVVLASLTKFA